jgi:hypothetical protein
VLKQARREGKKNLCCQIQGPGSSKVGSHPFVPSNQEDGETGEMHV